MPLLDEALDACSGMGVNIEIKVTRPGSDLADRVGAACATSLADFKRPREVRLVDSMPRSTLEKVAKAQLRAALEAEGPMG